MSRSPQAGQVTSLLNSMNSSIQQANPPAAPGFFDLEVPPIQWPQAQTIQAPRPPVRNVYPAADFFTPPQAVPVQVEPETSIEALVRNMPGLDKFNNLIATVSSIPDGPLKELHYAALEGVLQGELPVKQIQHLIPQAGKQFGEFYHDALSGGRKGTAVLDVLRQFQKLLKDSFDMRMEMSDSGLYLGEGNSSGASAWMFVPTAGTVSAGSNYVHGSESIVREMDPHQALKQIRNKFSQALDFVALAS